MNPALQALRDESARYLAETYPGRLARALEELPEADLWWRPHERVLSFGTVLVHLEGNVRQWILSGLAGQEDLRRRGEEFARTEQRQVTPTELMAKLQDTCREAAQVVRELGDEGLGEPVRIQGFDTTVAAAVLHVVEHFSWHTGQAVWIAKARGGPGHGIAFYDDAALERGSSAHE